MKLDRLYQPFQIQPAMTYKTKCSNAVLLITCLGPAECAKRLHRSLVLLTPRVSLFLVSYVTNDLRLAADRMTSYTIPFRTHCLPGIKQKTIACFLASCTIWKDDLQRCEKDAVARQNNRIKHKMPICVIRWSFQASSMIKGCVQSSYSSPLPSRLGQGHPASLKGCAHRWQASSLRAI